MGHTFVTSLLLQLLWYIGGSPPVLRDRTALLLILLLVTSLGDACDPWSHDGAWLSDPQMRHDLQSADLVATARVVSRSRSAHGSYSATFLLEKIMKKKVSKDLIQKFVRIRLETRKKQKEHFRSQGCGHVKVKPNSKYLIMLRKNNQDWMVQDVPQIENPIQHYNQMSELKKKLDEDSELIESNKPVKTRELFKWCDDIKNSDTDHWWAMFIQKSNEASTKVYRDSTFHFKDAVTNSKTQKDDGDYGFQKSLFPPAFWSMWMDAYKTLIGKLSKYFLNKISLEIAEINKNRIEIDHVVKARLPEEENETRLRRCQQYIESHSGKAIKWANYWSEIFFE